MPTTKKPKISEPEKTNTPAVKKDTRTYFYAVGKRKTAIATVRLYPKGTGSILINNKKLEEFFFEPLTEKVIQPLHTLGKTKDFDVVVRVKGGGIASQADAARHGLSKALSLLDEGTRTTLKRSGLLTRDARIKERKKFGLKKARRAPQWSKR